MYNIVFGFFIISCLLSAFMLLVFVFHDSGILFGSSFVMLSLGFRGYAVMKGYTYTMMIIAAVMAAMYFPQYFITIGSFKLDRLITPLLQIIMFGMGTAMSASDFVGVIKMPKGVIVGTLNHFTIMPLLGFTLANIFHFPPEIAAGIILIGCSPCGMASNVISYLARANLALSITLTTSLYISGASTHSVVNEITRGAIRRDQCVEDGLGHYENSNTACRSRVDLQSCTEG